MSPKTHWLCDMENVQSRWSRIESLIQPGDAVTIFLSDKASKFDLLPFAEMGARNIAFYFAKCENGKPNAMDFQMMCELGRLSIQYPESAFRIVSSDTGFDSVLDYMRERNIDISRFDPRPELEHDVHPEHTDAKQSEPLAIKTVYMDKLKTVGVNDPGDLKIMSAIIYEAMKRPQNRRKIDVMNRLTKRFGAKDGHLLYALVKPVVHDVAVNGPFPDPNAEHHEHPDHPDLTPNAINIALGQGSVPLKEGTVKKCIEAIIVARKTDNSLNALSKKLAKIVGKQYKLQALNALRPFL